MCPIYLSLHIECMAHRVEDERVEDQERDIDEQHAAHAHAGSQDRCGSLPQEATDTCCHRAPDQNADQCQGKKDGKEYQKGCEVTKEQSAKATKRDKERNDNESGDHKNSALHQGISYDGAYSDASDECGEVDSIITEA